MSDDREAQRGREEYIRVRIVQDRLTSRQVKESRTERDLKGINSRR